jgi:uncharacterized protein
MDPATRPFCSHRCRIADLGRWLSEDYRVAGEGTDAALDDSDADARARNSRQDHDTDD